MTMKRVKQTLFATLLLLFFGYIASLAIDAWWVPSTPSYGPQMKQLEERAYDIVHQQWVRPLSIPSEQDITDYRNIIAEIEAMEQNTRGSYRKESDKMLDAIRDRHTAATSGMIKTYQFLEPAVGRTFAELVANVLYQPRIAAIESRGRLLSDRDEVVRAPFKLLVQMHYQFAHALILKGDNAGATQQMIRVIEIAPDYATVNHTYMVGGRCGALSNPEFCQKFKAIGGDLERLRKDYVDRPAKLGAFMLWGTKYHRYNYEDR